MNFFSSQLLPLVTLEKSYDPYLVALSIIIAIISSFTAFGVSERIRASSVHLHKTLWFIFGAASLGVGVWSMHFIGTLALQLPISIVYNLNITLLSIIPAMMVGTVILWLINQTLFDLRRLLFCGLLMGSGMGVMHYTGMTAMELNAGMVYLTSIFILSLFIAVLLSTIALKINFEVTNQAHYQLISAKQSFSALIMGLAVSGIHYTAMQAIDFVPIKNTNLVVTGVDASVLSGIISLVAFLVLIVALIVPHMLRFRQMVGLLQKNEQDLKIAATVFQTQEAILITDENAKIIRVNDAFTRSTGYTETDVIGKNPRILKSGKHDEYFYKNCWDTIVKEGQWSGEIWNRRKNGEAFLEWQTISTVRDKQGKTTHYVSFYSDLTEFKLAEKEIKKLAYYDPLTELPNRRLLYERLEHELNLAKRYLRAGIVLFLDLDRFKKINDSLGHSVGDQILIETARRLLSLLRETDTAVRLGGDEFIVLITAQDGIHTDLVEQSSVIAEKIISTINSPYLVDGHELHISTSIGITTYTGMTETAETILKRADIAMYQAKIAGRNTFRFYQQSMQDAADTRLQIEKDLRTAVKNNEFSLYYQPQLSDKNKIIGVEALLRWQNIQHEKVPPIEFIRVAEETGLIITIGQWVIETVCEQIKLWDKQGIHIPHIAINISAKQFHQADFVSILINTVDEKQIKPQQIMLEITEKVFLGNLEGVVNKMNALKEKGFRFSIDDFGIGYSSLTYLNHLPFDQLKIDQSFIRGLVNNTADAAIVKAIVIMAKDMNLNLIAEGVETDQHLAHLSDFGCQNYQGYFFSKPLPAEKLSKFIKKLKKNSDKN